jgi:23S rRNA maturation mini-RNase III
MERGENIKMKQVTKNLKKIVKKGKRNAKSRRFKKVQKLSSYQKHLPIF